MFHEKRVRAVYIFWHGGEICDTQIETGGFCVLKDEFMTQVEVGGRTKVEDKQCKFLMDLDCLELEFLPQNIHFTTTFKNQTWSGTCSLYSPFHCYIKSKCFR